MYLSFFGLFDVFVCFYGPFECACSSISCSIYFFPKFSISCHISEPEKLTYDNNNDDPLKSYPKCYSTINSLEGFVSQSNHHDQNSAMLCDKKSPSKDHHKSFPDLIHHTHHHHLTLSRTPKCKLIDSVFSSYPMKQN